jgi:hypothetical protein
VSSILEEVVAGFDEVAQRGVGVARSMSGALDGSGRGTRSGSRKRRPAESGRAHVDSADGDLADQLLELTRQLLGLASGTAGRLLELAAGPIDQMLDPELEEQRDAWLSLEPVAPGETATGSFLVVEDNRTAITMRLVLPNPLAGMNSSLPEDAVWFWVADASLVKPRQSPPVTRGRAGEGFTVHVPRDGEVTVHVEVNVPLDTPSGSYVAIVRSPDVDGFYLVLEATVT